MQGVRSLEPPVTVILPDRQDGHALRREIPGGENAAQRHALDQELDNWHVNTGGKTIHAKRMAGRFRSIKNYTAALYLVFFLGPYLRWDGRQAVLFDIPGRQFHLFGVTILPQDVWMLSLVLLFLAITLFAATSIAGRVFCGYFCFQTIWTDAFTWIEEKIEGNPTRRHKLGRAPWDAAKVRIKASKHALWLVISMLTGVSFAAWFTDAYQLWRDYFTLQAHVAAWAVLGLLTGGTYLFAGFMREQTCFWLCPYARIQGVMSDRQTILPAYDFRRGEPRGKFRKGMGAEKGSAQGDCVDCFQCVAVCPTGVDIRAGQQEGCITCGLCIDACDAVMDKIARPRGLIRYASLDEIEGRPVRKLLQRPRVLVYFFIIFAALAGIGYGLTHLGSLTLQVMHDRQPLFVRQSDGSIQNRYEIKILNKTERDIPVRLSISAGIPGGRLIGADGPLLAHHGRTTSYTVYVRAPAGNLVSDTMPLEFRVASPERAEIGAAYQSMFMGPVR